MQQADDLPYWQVNVPEEDRTEACPEFLQNLSAKDVGILSTPDHEYHILTWPEVQERVRANRLDLFQRIPSELRRYRHFLSELGQNYGSVMNFIMAERLHWTQPISAKGRPFEVEEDLKILYNDWPYGIDARIVHLVVWTKFELAEDPVTGDLTDDARREIDDYVDETFRSQVPNDRVSISHQVFLAHGAYRSSFSLSRLSGSRTGRVSSPSRQSSTSTL